MRTSHGFRDYRLNPEIETIAKGHGVRIRDYLWDTYGRGRWRKMKGIAEVRYPDGAYGGTTLVRSARNRQTKPKDQARPAQAVNRNHRAVFVMCIDNEGYEVSLDVGKVYRTLPEKDANDHGMIRVVDNEGEDYLYSKRHFVEVKLPRAAQEAVLRAR